jgi:Mg/Co/Ni transporter MgtE
VFAASARAPITAVLIVFELTDAGGILLGVVAAVDLEQAVTRDSTQIRLAGDLMREAPKLLADDSLEEAVAVLAAGDDEGIPVVDSSDRMVGWLTHRRVLRAYRERSERSATPDWMGLPGPTDAERSEAPDYESTAARARAALTSDDKVATS